MSGVGDLRETLRKEIAALNELSAEFDQANAEWERRRNERTEANAKWVLRRTEKDRLAADLARVTAERDALLVVRDAMQSQLDAWFVAHPHPPEASS